MKKFLLAALLVLFAASPIASESLNPFLDKNLASVVHLVGVVMSENGTPFVYGCTAFSIAPRKLMTAAHCVPSNMVSLSADRVRVYPIKIDVAKDLAILLWDKELPALSFRDSPLVRYEAVTALGYGYSFAHPTVTFHQVIMLNYSPDPDEIWPGTWYMGGFIGGMSGGPVIDKDGFVVGVVQRGSAQMGYGVSVATIREFLADEPISEQ